jgi:hypothetical protein
VTEHELGGLTELNTKLPKRVNEVPNETELGCVAVAPVQLELCVRGFSDIDQPGLGSVPWPGPGSRVPMGSSSSMNVLELQGAEESARSFCWPI